MIFFAETDMGRQLQPSGQQVYTVRTLSLIRQDVEQICNRLDVKATLLGRQSLFWKLSAAEVVSSKRCPIQDRISAILESQLHSWPSGRSQLPSECHLEKIVPDMI